MQWILKLTITILWIYTQGTPTLHSRNKLVLTNYTTTDLKLVTEISKLAETFHPQVDTVYSKDMETLFIFTSHEEARKLFYKLLNERFNIHSHHLPRKRLQNIRVSGKLTRRTRSVTDSNNVLPIIDLNEYNTHNNIMRYLEYVSEQYSDLCSLVDIGYSYEGRPLQVMKITAPTGTKMKPKIFIDGGQHGREWISPAVVLQLIQLILDGVFKHKDNSIISFISKYELHLLPVLNPDGYVYTYIEEGERLWRKTRRPTGDGLCFGIDLNRNWDFQWGGQGGSNYGCSPIYHGKQAFSEPETQASATYIRQQQGWHSYFSLHSFGQMILFPYSHTSDQSPDYFNHLTAGRALAAGILNTNNNTYITGAVGIILYSAAGSSESWAYGAAGFPYAYTVELPNKYNFVLPPDRIAPTAREVLTGLLTYYNYIENNDRHYTEFIESLQQYDTETTTSQTSAVKDQNSGSMTLGSNLFLLSVVVFVRFVLLLQHFH